MSKVRCVIVGRIQSRGGKRVIVSLRSTTLPLGGPSGRDSAGKLFALGSRRAARGATAHCSCDFTLLDFGGTACFGFRVAISSSAPPAPMRHLGFRSQSLSSV